MLIIINDFFLLGYLRSITFVVREKKEGGREELGATKSRFAPDAKRPSFGPVSPFTQRFSNENILIRTDSPPHPSFPLPNVSFEVNSRIENNIHSVTEPTSCRFSKFKSSDMLSEGGKKTSSFRKILYEHCINIFFICS